MGYTDSDFADNRLDRKSTSGYLLEVTWKLGEVIQNVVSLSSEEAEYRAMHLAITELSDLTILLTKLWFGPKTPIVLFCDNMAAIEITNKHVDHNQTKHVELHKSYIKDNLDSGTIEVPYTRNSGQFAYIMTHSVTSGSFYISPSSWACVIFTTQLEGRISETNFKI